jgi:hypothetical protein
MKKRKRAPGGGRRPGQFGKLEAVMSLRLPEKLKEELEQAANQNGRTLSGEMIWRLNASFASPSADPGVEAMAHQVVRQLESMSKSWTSVLAEARRDLGMKSKGDKQ